MSDTETFERYRADLMGLAYRMTGSVTDAEDMVQDTWLRWQRVNSGDIENPRAYLHKILTRLCLDRAKSAHMKRETYVGPWLPEPVEDLNLIAQDISPDKQVELADDLSFALLLTMEKLSPLERAAFLLHDVFDYSFDEVAESLQRTPEACRKLASRARQHIRDTRPAKPVEPTRFEKFASVFLLAIENGDVSGLSKVLAEDAILFSDGGGKKISALNPIYGRDNILKFTAGVTSKSAPYKSVDIVSLNGSPALKICEDDGSLTTLSMECNQDGIIERIYIVRNPDKLLRLH